jgi:hypothetical protein
MNDLVRDYFQGDLNSQGEEELARQLGQSMEASNRFAELAASDYERLGLPEPKWPAKRRRLAWLLALALIPAGLWYLKQPQPNSYVEAPVLGSQSVPFEEESPGEEKAAGERTVTISRPASRLRLQVQGTPKGFKILLSSVASKVGALSVCERQGREIRRLNLLDGSLWFWDGLDQSGKRVSPGPYLLRVQADGQDLKQWVQIVGHL